MHAQSCCNLTATDPWVSYSMHACNTWHEVRLVCMSVSVFQYLYVCVCVCVCVIPECRRSRLARFPHPWAIGPRVRGKYLNICMASAPPHVVMTSTAPQPCCHHKHSTMTHYTHSCSASAWLSACLPMQAHTHPPHQQRRYQVLRADHQSAFIRPSGPYCGWRTVKATHVGGEPRCDVITCSKAK